MDLKTWHNLPEAAKEAAIEWHVRLTSGGASDSDYAAFADWAAGDPGHMAALDYVESYAGKLEDLRRADHASLKHLVQIEKQAVPAPRSRWRTYAAIAATLIAGFIGAGVLLSPQFSKPATEQYASDDAIQKVTLADGTIVTLAPGARMAASLEKNARRIISFEGVGYFDVASDKTRPFTIAFGDDLITVVGTEFEVKSFATARSVSVAEGVVTVGSEDKARGEPNRLVAGKRLIIDDQTEKTAVEDIDASAVSAWRDGLLTFEDSTIVDVAARLNDLYGDQTFKVADEATGQLRFSGVLQLSDADSVARRVSEILPVAVSETNGQYVLSGAVPQEK